jgi:hypothetical protein
VGFKEVKSKAIKCLDDLNFDHEPRADRHIKNLLYTQAVTPAEVKEMIHCCGGTEHKSDFHDMDRSITIHILKPKGKYDGWYVKFYFVDDGTMFISVHS